YQSPAIGGRQQVYSSQRGTYRGGRPQGVIFHLWIKPERAGGGAAADVSAPIALAPPLDAVYPLANHQRPDVVPAVRYKLLQVQHGPKVFEHPASPQQQGFVVH